VPQYPNWLQQLPSEHGLPGPQPRAVTAAKARTNITSVRAFIFMAMLDALTVDGMNLVVLLLYLSLVDDKASDDEAWIL
jgi:hypothetical protein